MNERIVNQICEQVFHQKPLAIQRNLAGLGSFVYIVSYPEVKFVVKTSENTGIIRGSVYWLEQLKELNIPIPGIIALNYEHNPAYCIMTFLEGSDLGLVYSTLSAADKKRIARQIFDYQNIVQTIPRAKGFGYLHSYDDAENRKSSWNDVVYAHIKRSEHRICQNKLFNTSYTDILLGHFPYFRHYFSRIQPKAFFDDTTTKNLLIQNGSISGIVDLDWVCFGDRLYVIALTALSLLAMKLDLTYVDYWIELEQPGKEQEQVLIFYMMVFCADFMSEKGMKFNKEHSDPVTKEEKHLLQNLFTELDRKLQLTIGC